MLRRLTTLALCFWLSPAVYATPQSALTVYGDAPKYGPGFTHLNYANPNAPKGGSLSRSSLESGQYDHILPYIDKGTGVAEIDGWLYSPLAYRSFDEPYSVYGLVAQQMELAPDRSWLRFYLNPAARFDDGSPITAEDVRYTFELLTTQGSLQYRVQFADVAEVIVESPTQVRFVFKNSESRTLPLDLATLPVLPEHWWRKRNFADGGGFEAPLGSGPYRISQVDAGRSVHFERVKDWWARDLPVTRGLYNFDRLSVEFFADTSVSQQVLKAGAFDYNREFSATAYTIGYGGPALSDGRLVREHLAPGAARGSQGFVFNLKKPLFQDRRVRQAIALLWDFEWSNRQMMRGMYLRQRSYFSHSELSATQLPDAEELKILEPWRGKIPDEVFTQVFQPPHTDGSGNIRSLQLQALKLLKEAGWKPQGDQLVNAEGQALHFTFLNGQKGFERLLLPFKRNLAQIGIGFDIRQVDTAQYANRVRSRDYDMIVNAYPVSQAPGREMFNYFAGESADDPGSNNYMTLRDPAVDALLTGLIQADSRTTMLHYAHALDRVLQWGYYWIPNYYPPGISTVWWNRFGRPKVAPLYDAGLETWWEISPSALTQSQLQNAPEIIPMWGYSLRRLLLIVPTLLCILLVNFVIVQAAPGGPVEQAIARLQGIGVSGAVGGGHVETVGGESRATRGLDPKLLADIERQYGFDKPPGERLWLMLKQYARLDFGASFFRGAKVTDLILQKLPVTLSLGLWATLITYLVSIPLGIRKAVHNGTAFDVWSSAAIIIGYALPGFLFALLLIITFGGGSALDWFPVRGLVSENFAQLSPWGKVVDYFWHLVLPVSALVIGGFATLTLLTKNSFLGEISRQYVVTARAKGLSEHQVLYGHVFRNAMLLVVAGLPQALVTVFFGGSLLIEVIFSLDGLGRMSYEAAVARDYPVVFGSLFIFTLFGLLIKLLGDLCYTLVDPRIDFSRRAA